jgi:Flp pilus assembly protein TadG
LILSDTTRQIFGRHPLRATVRRLGEQQAQSLVETALSITVLMILIFAAIEAAWGAYSIHYLANAAHEATRYAVVRGGTWNSACDPSGSPGAGYGSSMCQASPTDIENYVANRDFPGIGITASDVCVEYFSSLPTSATQACYANSSPNAAGDIVQVTITYPFSIPLPFLANYTWHLASTSQMVIAQ